MFSKCKEKPIYKTCRNKWLLLSLSKIKIKYLTKGSKLDEKTAFYSVTVDGIPLFH